MEYALAVLVSIVVDIAKRFWKTNSLGTYALLAVFALLASSFYVWGSQAIWWEQFVQIVIVASAFHNIILRRLEEPIKKLFK